MEESVNYAEYTVAQKPEGKRLRAKILIIALYAVIVFAYLGVMVALSNFGVLVAIITLPFIPLTIMIVKRFTWDKYVDIEHKFEVVNANFRVTRIFGHRTEDVLEEHLVSSFKKIAPLSEVTDALTGAEVHDYRGTASSPDSYAAIWEEGGKTKAILFEATAKLLKMMKFYNSAGTVVGNVRY